MWRTLVGFALLLVAIPAAAGEPVYASSAGRTFLLELGAEARGDARPVRLQCGFRVRDRWGSFTVHSGLVADVHDYGPDGVDDDGDGDVNDDDDRGGAQFEIGVGVAGPWRVAPFAEYNYDFIDLLFGDLFTAGDDEPNYNWALGLRWQLDRRWTLKAYHRVYRIDDGPLFDLTTPVNQRIEMAGVAVGLDF